MENWWSTILVTRIDPYLPSNSLIVLKTTNKGKVMLVNHKFENFAKCHLYNVFYAFVFVSLRNIVYMDFWNLLYQKICLFFLPFFLPNQNSRIVVKIIPYNLKESHTAYYEPNFVEIAFDLVEELIDHSIKRERKTSNAELLLKSPNVFISI